MSPVASVLPVELSPATTWPVLIPVPRVQTEPVVAHELVVDDRERLARLDGGPHRPQRVVLVEHRKAEDGDERIAGELLERPTVPRDDRGDLPEVTREDPSDRLRIEALAERRRPGDVDEENGDYPPGLDRKRLRHDTAAGRDARAAGRAELRTVRRSVTTLVAEHPSSVEAGVRSARAADARSLASERRARTRRRESSSS